jgi:lysophospholipase L1-like esterase
MRLFKSVPPMVALLLTATVAVVAAGTAHVAAPAYVALGDSYSSGVGSGSYKGVNGKCLRSSKAYPILWAAANSPAGFSFQACSGARTTDVIKSQLTDLGPDTRLVSISVGGNDTGFSSAMGTCVLSPSTKNCLSRIDTARAYIQNTLPGRLDAVYDAIRAKAPAARVVVLGYPRLYQLRSPKCADLSEDKRVAVNSTADLLDSVIEKRATDHGFAFGDVRSPFTGHELCSGAAWLHGVTYPVFESYHPTADGQSGAYLPALTAAA